MNAPVVLPFIEQMLRVLEDFPDTSGVSVPLGELRTLHAKAQAYEAILKTISGELPGVGHPAGQRELARAVLERWKND